jgi:lipoprotein-anchoring transpeptidase ErfK/SrfK
MGRISSILCILLLITSASHAAQRHKQAKIPRPSIDWSQANNAQIAEVGPDAGPVVLRSQILLDRAGFSPGEIDGAYGPNLRSAIRSFQAAHQLEPNDKIDAQTWMLLNADTADVFVSYEISETDIAGPFQKIPADMMQKATLPSLGYESTLEMLGEKFHVSPKLLALLNSGKTFDHAGETIMAPSVRAFRAFPGGEPKAASIVVKKSDMTVSALDGQGKIMAQFPASAGSEHDPLPIGNWKINGVAKEPPFHYNPELFWDSDPKHLKAKIAPGPNNPVGLVWIDLSKEHYGIHGTPEPSLVGHTQSHGCIRLTNWDAVRLASMVGPGTPAILME